MSLVALRGPALGALLACAAALAATGPPPAARTGPARLAIDPERSEVGFLMHTTWHDVHGKGRGVTGAVTSESGELFRDGRVAISVEAAGLQTGNGKRDRTMREDHLETARHPTITFASTAPPEILSSVADAAGGYTEVALRIRGDLTIHGVTREAVLSVTARREGGVWSMIGEAPVRLSDHKIPDPSIMFNRVQDEVKVTFTVHTKPAAP